LRAGGDVDAPVPAVWSDELAQRLQSQRDMIDRIRQIYEGVAAGTLTEARKDIQRLVESIDDRKRELLSIKTKYQQEFGSFDRYGGLDPCQVTLLADIDASVFDVEALEAAPAKLNDDANRLEALLNSYAEPLAAIQAVIESLIQAETKPSADEIGFEMVLRIVVCSI
jgi:hypothetical protein